MNFKKLAILSIMCLPAALSAAGEEQMLNLWFQPAAKAHLSGEYNAGLYTELGSRFNTGITTKNYKTGEMVDQDAEGMLVNEAAIGPYFELKIFDWLPMENQLLYRLQHWSVEDNSFNIHSIDNRTDFFFSVGYLKFNYRLTFWLKLPYTRFEGLYQLKDPSLDPLKADDSGKYYAYDHTRVDYGADVINRHLLGLNVPLKPFFGSLGWSDFFTDKVDFFLKGEIYLNLTPLKNNEFLTQDHGLNIFGDMISMAGTKVGYEENMFMRYRIYAGFDIRLNQNLLIDTGYIYESNFYYDRVDPVKRGEANQTVHYIKAGLLYTLDLSGQSKTNQAGQAKTEEKTEKQEPPPEEPAAEAEPVAEDEAPADTAAEPVQPDAAPEESAPAAP